MWTHIARIDNKWYIDGVESIRPEWIGEFPVGNILGIWIKR